MHEGQSEGLHRKWSLYLARRSKEEPDLDVEAFYERLIEVKPIFGTIQGVNGVNERLVEASA